MCVKENVQKWEYARKVANWEGKKQRNKKTNENFYEDFLQLLKQTEKEIRNEDEVFETIRKLAENYKNDCDKWGSYKKSNTK